MKLNYIASNSKYENIKQVLKEEFMVSDRLLLKLKSNQKIYQNGQIASVHSSVLQNDVIEVFLDIEEDNSNIVPVKMDLSILYEDDSLLILNKQAGIPIHPSRMHYEDSLSNGVAYYFHQMGLKKKIRPVNRLDKDTSRYCYFCKKRIRSRISCTSNERKLLSKAIYCDCKWYYKRKIWNHSSTNC